jgi:hypothetical protein
MHHGVTPTAALVVVRQVEGEGGHPVAHELAPPLGRQALQPQIDGKPANS